MKLDRAFPVTPDAFIKSIDKGIRKGEKQMRFKNKLRLSLLASALAACFLVVAFAVGGSGGTTDVTAASTPESTKGTSPAVFSSVSGTPSPDPTPKPVTTPEPTPEPKYPADDGGDSSVIYVFATQHGIFYHLDANCSGMKDAELYTLDEAEKAEKKPCPICIGEGGLDAVGHQELEALRLIKWLFPGAIEAYTVHYNAEEISAVNAGDNEVKLYAGQVSLGSVYLEEDSWQIELHFTDKVIAKAVAEDCAAEGHVSERVSSTVKTSRLMLGSIGSAISDSEQRSDIPSEGDSYSLQRIYLSGIGMGETDDMELTFRAQNSFIAELRFDINVPADYPNGNGAVLTSMYLREVK